ncbi:MAG: S8 family serine peptidase [Planctomycetes bacterium]|nr:S8 family serine peptidase [Planctomycetota bacterium]MCB9891083.1 S8 family serine peptidase [Planctomycetota bacterium]MCB9916956.1 S8 family serine peptidase [Planctomycetota bacterium]
MRSPFFAVITAALSLPSIALNIAVAQNVDGVAPELQQQRQPLPGLVAGTESWIVHFQNRPFDLSAFRAEMYGNKNPEVIATIVKDLEAKVQEHQKKFCNDIVALGGRVTHQWWLVNACCIEVAPRHLAAIRQMGNVAMLEPNVEVMPLIKTATNAANHNSDALNAKGVTGNGVACAIIDTGQDSNMNGTGVPHITYSRLGTAATRLVKNMQIGTQPPDDVHGHGTGVASIAAGYKWNNTAADNGHAYNANIVGYSIANTTSGSSSAANEASGYQNAAADAASFKIVATNLSYSGSSNVVDVAALAQDSAALNADLLNATAAGNSGTSVASSLPNVNGLSVGAVNNDTHTLASFSSRGVQGGRLFPNLCANGVSTVMALRNNESGNYTASGTSMASPQVCGAATLIRGANTALKSDETRAILLASTELNPGSGSGLNSTGTGAGYLRDDRAYDVATTASQHGRATLNATTTSWTRSIAVTAAKTVQIGIAWHRLDVTTSGTTWSNLDVELKRGTTVLASSKTASNTEEFIRYVPATTETLTIVVTLVGGVVGGSAQPFGWATWIDGATTKVPGEYVLYGSGCKGTGTIPGGGPVVPSGGYDSTFGNSANRFPLATGNMHYMQSHGSGEFAGVTPIYGFNFRNRTGFAQNAGTIDIAIFVGYTANPANALVPTYASNWTGTPTKVYSGTLNVPAFASQTDPKVWTLKIPFVAPFIYAPSRGNFLWEAQTNATTIASPNYYDSVSATTVDGARIYNTTSSTATTGTVAPGYVVVTQLASPGGTGAIVAMSNTGVPEINTSFQLAVTQARPSSVAILYLGASQLNVSLGALAAGCSVYCSYDVLLGAVPTNATGSGSLTLPVPNSTGLIGIKFYNQYIVLDAPANTLGLTFTNGGAGKIGG